MSSFYDSGWRTGDAGGTVNWSDAWTAGQYAQQIKGAGGVDDEYSKRFDTLQKSDSSVDDEEGWRTVTNLRNNDSANIQSIQKQAAEWKAKGFDVRVQDLDESHGAEWADLAVRRGQGKPAADPEPKIEEGPVVHSDRLIAAKERVQKWIDPNDEDYHNFSNRIFGDEDKPKQYDFSSHEYTA